MSEERFKAAARRLREALDHCVRPDIDRDMVLDARADPVIASAIATEVSAALERASEECMRISREDGPQVAYGCTSCSNAIRRLIPSDSALPALLAAERRRGAEEALRAVYGKSYDDLIDLDALLAPAAEGGE